MRKIKEIHYNKKHKESIELEIIPFKSLNKILLNTKDHDPFLPHQLKFNVLMVITGGDSGKHNIDFKEYTYRNQSVILIAKNQIHNFFDIPSNNEGFVSYPWNSYK